MGKKASEASENGGKGKVLIPTPSGEGISSTETLVSIEGVDSTDTPRDWTAINAENPPPWSAEDEAWQAVEAAGFGNEPLIALAFGLFGPGCQVIPSGEAASV